MTRTQIYLPEYQYKKLKEKAKTQDITFAQVVRELLRIGMQTVEGQQRSKRSKPKQSGAKYLLEMAKEAEKLSFEGPVNLSTTVDEVLYGLKK